MKQRTAECSLQTAVTIYDLCLQHVLVSGYILLFVTFLFIASHIEKCHRYNIMSRAISRHGYCQPLSRSLLDVSIFLDLITSITLFIKQNEKKTPYCIESNFCVQIGSIVPKCDINRTPRRTLV